MSENENKTPDKEKKKSFLETYNELKEKERAEEIKRESKAEAARAEKERKAREQYAEKLRQEKLELLKLKQGVISEEDMPAEEKVEKHYTAGEKIGNFFYHYKLYIIITTAVVLMMGFLIYDIISKIEPDVSIMFIATDDAMHFKAADMESVLEQYCPDCNGDGKIKVQIMYVPVLYGISENGEPNGFALQEVQANHTKLISEFQTSDTIIIIADKAACDEVGVTDEIFADINEIFPDDENVEGYCYLLKGTNLAADIEYDGLSEELFAAFRKPQSGLIINTDKFERNFNGAVEMWTNYISGNVINPKDQSNGK